MLKLREFLLHLERKILFKAAFPAHLEWNGKQGIVIPGQREDRAGPTCPRGTAPTLLGEAGLSLTELWIKKEFCISSESACPAISCDQSMETAACLSSLAVKAAAALLCAQPGRSSHRGRRQWTPRLCSATLHSLNCNLLSATYSINPSSSSLKAKL